MDHVLREEVAGAQLRDAWRHHADAGGVQSLTAAVAAVRPAVAQLVGHGVHHRVHDLLGEPAQQLPHVDWRRRRTGAWRAVQRQV